MGTYNTYGNVQIKVGLIDMKKYKIDDKVDIPDGIYVGYGGAIVIKDGIFVMEVRILIDKWGKSIDCLTVLRGRGLLDEVLDKTEVTTEEKPAVEVTHKEEVVEAPKAKEPEKKEEKKETTAPEVAPKVDEKEVKVEEPKVEEKKEEVTPEKPKEEKKD